MRGTAVVLNESMPEQLIPYDWKRCSRCGETKHLYEFPRDKNRPDERGVWCNACNRAQVRAWQLANPERVREHRRVAKFRDLGVTPEWYEETLAAQGGGCAICGMLPGDRRLDVDHDHTCCPGRKRACGKCARALLCRSCNLLLGRIEADVERTRAALEYLARWQVRGGDAGG